jgi:hypothetical protein
MLEGLVFLKRRFNRQARPSSFVNEDDLGLVRKSALEQTKNSR